MADPNKRYLQALDLQQYLTPIGAAKTWIGDRKTLAAFGSWVYKVPFYPKLGAGGSPCAGLLDYRDGLPKPPGGETSYDGAAFLHAASRTLIVASRGSETLEDWITNVAAALGIFWRQLGPAVSFATSAVQSARRILGEDVAQVLFAGNSLGGACAEAQAALLNAELTRQGEQAVKKIGGDCTGSAGFANVIREYAQQRFPGLGSLPAPVTHLIRENDPILASHPFGGGTLGAIDKDIASIWIVNFVTRNPRGGKGTRTRRWELQADASNHNDYYYFRFNDVPGAMHVVKPKSKDFFWAPGEEPEKLTFKIDELPPKYA